MNILRKLSLMLVLALPLAANAAPRTPFTDAEIDQLLAPIALYPDTVLSHVLIAATVPEDVSAAANWVYRHPHLRGQEAVDAVERYDWDPSVKALVAFPEVIERMDEDPDWTEDLGLAFLEQEEIVMDRVQYLRDKAYDNGSLDDLEHVRVVREREYIYIEPAVTRVVYVPYYNPLYVYGHWWWASYPPHCWNWWGGYPARYYGHSAFFWGVSYHVGPTWYAGSFNWRNRHVVVTRPHRHYAPSPGYSGRSTMRRETIHLSERQARHNSAGRPAGTPRGNTVVRRGHERHDEGATHVPQGRREARRDYTEVRAQLTARRGNSQRSDANRRDERSSAGDRVARADVQRSSEDRRQDLRAESRQSPRVRSESRPQPRVDREARAVERAPERAIRAERSTPRSEPRGESRSEPRSQPSNEPRSESRGESRGVEGRGGDRGDGGRGNSNGGGSRMRIR
jgi:hypothetical protein